jgi:hypothetical protein
MWRVSLEECGEAIEIGEGVLRPINGYRAGHGRYSGVPQVRSHRTTRSCGTVP